MVKCWSSSYSWKSRPVEQHLQYQQFVCSTDAKESAVEICKTDWFVCWLRIFLLRKNFAVLWMFAGFEVSGIVDEICPSISDCSLSVGDRVVVYPTNDEELTETGLVNGRLILRRHDKHGDSPLYSFPFCRFPSHRFPLPNPNSIPDSNPKP